MPTFYGIQTKAIGNPDGNHPGVLMSAQTSCFVSKMYSVNLLQEPNLSYHS